MRLEKSSCSVLYMYKERERERERRGSHRLSETVRKRLDIIRNSYSSWLMMRNVGHLWIIIKSHVIKHPKGIPLIQMYKQILPLNFCVCYFRDTEILVFTFYLVFLRHLSPFHFKMYYMQKKKKRKTTLNWVPCGDKMRSVVKACFLSLWNSLFSYSLSIYCSIYKFFFSLFCLLLLMVQ